MSARPRFRCVFWCSLICAVLVPTAARSTEPPPSAEQKILAALNRTVDVDLVNVPFGDRPRDELTTRLQELLGVPVVFDRAAMADVGCTAVTWHLKGVRARSALTLILDQLELTWVIRDEVVLITTPEKARKLLVTRVYDVSDLVVFGPEPDAVDFDSLIELLTVAVAPVSWDDVGGAGSIAPLRAGGAKAIVISQTWPIHRQIEQLLASLRAAGHDPAAARKAVSIPIAPDSPQEEAIRRVLAQPIDLKFSRTPLDAALGYLRDVRKIEVQLDRRALEEVGFETDMAVTFHRKGLPLCTALRHMLKELDLTYMIRDDVLWITTSEECEDEAFDDIRLYEVTDLVLPPDAPACDDPRAMGDFDSLIDTITCTVQVTSWSEVGGPGNIVPLMLPRANLLVLQQMPDVQEEVGQLLTGLRRVKGLGALAKLATVPVSLPVPERSAAETAVRAALIKPVDVAAIEQPLDDTLENIEQQIVAPILIDRRALDDVGVAPETHVTRNLKGISARSALKLLLYEHGLTYLVDGEVILITTPEEAECRMITRLYPVGDLVGSDQPWRPDLAGLDTLADAIMAAVSPDTWDEQGGPGSVAPLYGYGANCLVVSQTEEIHEEIEPLLTALRTIHRKHAGLPVPPERPTAEDAILAALRKRVEDKFIETPFQDVVDYLKDVLRIEIQIDKRALDDVGIGTDTPVTISLKRTSGRAALNLVLRPLDLTWIIQDEVLLITTPEEAEARARAAVYDVTDLVPPLAGSQAETATPWDSLLALERDRQFTRSDDLWPAVLIRGHGWTAVVFCGPRDVREKFEDLLAQLRRVAKEGEDHHGDTEDVEKKAGE